MSTSDAVAAFRKADTSGLPDIHSLAEEKLKVFWVLHAAKNIGYPQLLSAAEISDILRDHCGVAISRQRVRAILSGQNGTVARSKILGKHRFLLMKAGEDELLASRAEPIFIDPSKALTKIRKFEEVLRSLHGDVRVCDPYVDHRTLDYLAECKSAASIHLLTINIYKEERFKRDLRAYNQEYSDRLEVRVLAGNQLHDRYVIHDDGMLLLGTSLNGLGGKQSIIVSLGDDIRRVVLSAYSKLWNTGRKYP